jgi:hypothetical protein
MQLRMAYCLISGLETGKWDLAPTYSLETCSSDF